MNATTYGRGVETLRRKMQETADNPVRRHVVETAKNFKTSWVDLGRALYSVWKDKLYKEWGFQKFETYTSQEIGIRKQTAMKLLRSYFFLEKEEPSLLKRAVSADDDGDTGEPSEDSPDCDGQEASQVPSFESVELLRQAKNNKKLDKDDYEALKKQIVDDGRDAVEVKKDLTRMIRERKELEPEEAREERRTAVVRRFLSTLKSLKMEMEAAKMLPASIARDVDALIERVNAELPAA
jgi:hypothetical protein